MKFKKYILLITGFILFTIIGTISHELGHLVVAEYLGYETTLHYGSVDFNTSILTEDLDSIYKQNKYEIENNLDFEEKEIFDHKLEMLAQDDFKILIGGPLQTILTGTIGFLVLVYRKSKIKKYGLKTLDWIFVFLSLFWLREIFNLVHSIVFELINREGNYFGGDERYISEFLQLESGTIPIILGIIGLVISLYVIFKILPGKLQVPFIISGLVGGASGFLLWFEILGPILIP